MCGAGRGGVLGNCLGTLAFLVVGLILVLTYLLLTAKDEDVDVWVLDLGASVYLLLHPFTCLYPPHRLVCDSRPGCAVLPAHMSAVPLFWSSDDTLTGGLSHAVRVALS